LAQSQLTPCAASSPRTIELMEQVRTADPIERARLSRELVQSALRDVRVALGDLADVLES